MNKHLTLTAIAGCMMLPGVTRAQGVEFLETEWAPGTFTTVINGWGVVGTASTVPQSSGGNPGAWLLVSNTVAAGSPAPFCCNSTYTIVFLHGWTFSPATTCGIESIDVTIDSKYVGNPFSCSCSGQSLVLTQGDRIFAATLPNTGLGWTTDARAALTPADFAEVLFQSASNSTIHPDFSPAGGTIQFGLARSNSSVPGGSSGYVLQTGVDNFRVVLHTCESCDPVDFNGDGLFPDTADIDDYLSVFSGGPCSTGTCGDIDFNNDGLFPDTADIDSLLSVFSGGTCL